METSNVADKIVYNIQEVGWKRLMRRHNTVPSQTKPLYPGDAADLSSRGLVRLNLDGTGDQLN